MDKALEILFKTKNSNKILPEYNKLTQKEKIAFLSSDKVKQRILKIADTELLTNILIELPHSFRKNFFNGANLDKYQQDYEQAIINFLQLPDYNNLNLDDITKLKNMPNRKTLEPIFRKLNTTNLTKILNKNISQVINSYSFSQLSKKSPYLIITEHILSNVDNIVLFTELKQRTKKNYKTDINIDIDKFYKLNATRQKEIFYNQSLESPLDKQILKKLQKEFADKTENELIQDFYKLIKIIHKDTEEKTETKLTDILKVNYILKQLSIEKIQTLMPDYFKYMFRIESEIEPSYYNTVAFLIKNSSSTNKDLVKLLKLKPYALFNYLKTGNIDTTIDKTLHKTITLEQYQKTNQKHINKLITLIKNLDEYSTKTDKITTIAYKLYYILGYANSVELLSQKYGSVTIEQLNNMLHQANIENVKFKQVGKNYEPIINECFINFIIGNKKDNNATIKRILRNELNIIYNNFSRIFNSIERFNLKIGNKLHLNNIIPLLQEKEQNRLLPHEYKLTQEILDDVKKSYRLADIPSLENTDKDQVDLISINQALNFYNTSLTKRITSSIPRIKGKTNDDYTYEILRLDDPLIMTLGYRTHCCFRLNGKSKKFLKYCGESKYARIIVIKNENNELCAMIPIIRNGNTVVGNSIECNKLQDEKKTYQAAKCAFDDIIKTSLRYENDPIIAGCITNLHNNVKPYSKAKLENKIYPIRNSQFYTNYDSELYLVSIQEGKTKIDFQQYIPDDIYMDERPQILTYRRTDYKDDQTKKEIVNRINSINYQKNTKEYYDIDFFPLTICNEDWYLLVHPTNIIGKYLPKDPRAKQEFDLAKTYLQEELESNFLFNIKPTDITEKSYIKQRIINRNNKSI